MSRVQQIQSEIAILQKNINNPNTPANIVAVQKKTLAQLQEELQQYAARAEPPAAQYPLAAQQEENRRMNQERVEQLKQKLQTVAGTATAPEEVITPIELAVEPTVLIPWEDQEAEVITEGQAAYKLRQVIFDLIEHSFFKAERYKDLPQSKSFGRGLTYLNAVRYFTGEMPTAEYMKLTKRPNATKALEILIDFLK